MSRGIKRDRQTVIEAIEPYLKKGLSVTQACAQAQIPQSTVATWISEDEDLRLKVQAWQNLVNVDARTAVIEKIKEGKSEDARWWLERYEDLEEQKKERSGVELGAPQTEREAELMEKLLNKHHDYVKASKNTKGSAQNSD